MRKATRVLLTAAALLATGTTLTAQQPAQGRGMGRQMQGGPMMMAPELKMYRPATVLKVADQLELSAAQIEEIQALAERATTHVQEARDMHHENRTALMQALKADDPDTSRISSLFWAAHGSMGKLHWTELDTALQTKRVLTSDQRMALMEASESL